MLLLYRKMTVYFLSLFSFACKLLLTQKFKIYLLFPQVLTCSDPSLSSLYQPLNSRALKDCSKSVRFSAESVMVYSMWCVCECERVCVYVGGNVCCCW